MGAVRGTSSPFTLYINLAMRAGLATALALLLVACLVVLINFNEGGDAILSEAADDKITDNYGHVPISVKEDTSNIAKEAKHAANEADTDMRKVAEEATAATVKAEKDEQGVKEALRTSENHEEASKKKYETLKAATAKQKEHDEHKLEHAKNKMKAQVKAEEAQKKAGHEKAKKEK